MLLLTLLPLAWPHAGAPLESIDVHRPDPAGRAMALESSVGFLWAPEGQGFEWICHEAITAPGVLRVPDYAVSAAGGMLGRVQDPSEGREAEEGLYVSQDGCDWAPAAGLSGRALAGQAFDPSDPSRAFVVTADVTANALLYSEDGGASFRAGALADVDAAFTSVVVEPEGPVWAAATDSEGGIRVYHSPDGLSDWTRTDLEGEGPLTLYDARGGVAWGALGPLTERLVLRLEEAGASASARTQEGRSITDIAAHADGSVWVAVANDYLYAADGQSFEEAAAPPGLGVTVGADAEVWLATRFELTNYALAIGDQERGFTQSFSFYELDGPPARCGAETDVGRVCPGDWETLEARLGLGPRDSALDSGAEDSGGLRPDKDCGCASGGAGGGWLLGLLALRRRRYQLTRV